MSEPLLGLVTGFLFGFLLQKGGVLRFDRQVGALLFRDMTLVKFMVSAMLVGSVGFQLLAEAKLIAMNHLAMNVGGVVLGGLLYGCGWAIAGYCPGTAVGALGEGRWTALFAIAGMLAGAALYAEAHPALKVTVLAWLNLKSLALPKLLGVSPWMCIAGLWGAGIVTFVWCEFKKV
ncbi:MAG TPA: YeeE/YedE thiosulfate transporter family protein [Kiritimatiellia bacterium]|nr:YeeE/YedE thiosulfate transporter family protein [Kiritimatiellia bacterium]HPS08779.1 YeeE/YedE thiosulfate transporter family protein [Kiritimatiellia bacterium]